jgi:hypothetical protein
LYLLYRFWKECLQSCCRTSLPSWKSRCFNYETISFVSQTICAFSGCDSWRSSPKQTSSGSKIGQISLSSNPRGFLRGRWFNSPTEIWYSGSSLLIIYHVYSYSFVWYPFLLHSFWSYHTDYRCFYWSTHLTLLGVTSTSNCELSFGIKLASSLWVAESHRSHLRTPWIERIRSLSHRFYLCPLRYFSWCADSSIW